MKYLIVGLGNIGDEYTNTRHNIGFKVLDAFAKASNVVFESSKLASVAKAKVKGRTLILIKPSTFMNLSGKAVNYWAQKEKIPLSNIIVIADDIALPLGSVRIRYKGGAGGHNGLQDIIDILQTECYARIRVGVGSDFSKGRQIDHVLGEWNEEELAKLPEILEHCTKAIAAYPLIGLEKTMNNFNKK